MFNTRTYSPHWLLLQVFPTGTPCFIPGKNDYLTSVTSECGALQGVYRCSHSCHEC